MAGDYTRFTHKPDKRYSGVLMQQGRVQLDADWNEEIDIIKRRWQLQAMDTFGPSAVPKETTPDAFKIGFLAGPPANLSLGAGRIYVDGLLAELFEGEQFKGNAITYLNQPFFPAPPALPANGEAIVFLDVWEREVTYIEDADLLEKALGGPDTATRTQTAWQVRVQSVQDAECGAALPRGSAGLLSSRAISPPAPDDPCIISPSGGYRGLENRLYRVEVHTAGTLATARFKWSQENASVVSRVTQITTTGSQSKLKVTRIGRDKILRFQVNDWVEILDDNLELNGQPGVMAKVTVVAEATQELTLDRDISAAGFNPADATRHTRVRRWNQRNNIVIDVGVETGLVGVSGGFIPLEDGVEVSFGIDPNPNLSGNFHVGDYWLFAARTVDGTVEELVSAPPRGIIHHYTQLGTLTGLGTNNPETHDCRNLWPECGCCCSIDVGDGVTTHGAYDDISDALATASAQAGPNVPIRICLLSGVHRLTQTVVITQDDVTITGCDRATHLIAPPAAAAFEIRGLRVTLEHLYVTSEEPSDPLISAIGSRTTRIQFNEFENSGGPVLTADQVTDFGVLGNTMTGMIGVAAWGQGILIARNRMTSDSEEQQTDRGLIDIQHGASLATMVENELINGSGHGITLTGVGADVATGNRTTIDDIRIVDNTILRMRGSGIGVLTELGERGVSIDNLWITGNVIQGCIRTDGPLLFPGAGTTQGGVVLRRVSHVVIADNRIAENGISQTSSPIAGILVLDCQGLVIRDNVIVNNGRPPDGSVIPGIQGGIIARDLSVVVESVDVAAPPDVDVIVPIQPDGWPAADMHGNLVVAPRGLALELQGIGPMQVTHNRFTSRDLVPTGDPAGAFQSFAGTVLILNIGMPAYAARQLMVGGFQTANQPTPSANEIFTVSGKVDFSNNQVALDLVRAEVELAVAAVAILTLDDLGFHDNQTECTLGLDGLLFDTLAFGTTIRAQGNGLTESFLFVLFSLYAYGLWMSTGTDNQGTHCIRIDGAVPARTIDRDNLELFCRQDFQGSSLFTRG